MIRIKYLVETVVLICLLGSCSSIKGTVPGEPLAQAYSSAKKKLKQGNYKDAIKDLEAIDERSPLYPYDNQVKLDLIYAYYKADDLAMTHTAVNRFLRFYPMDPQVDYVLYMRGLTDMALDANTLQGFLGVTHFDRSPEYARVAFQDFKELIQYRPNSRYAKDAFKRLVYLKNRLAENELSVIRYYNKRGAYIAVLNRAEQMLRDFPDTQAARRGLFYMEKAFRQLHLNNQAAQVASIIAKNLN